MNKLFFAAATVALLAGAPAAFAQATGAATAGKPAPAKPSTPTEAMGSPAAPTDCAKLTEAKAHEECMMKSRQMNKKM